MALEIKAVLILGLTLFSLRATEAARARRVLVDDTSVAVFDVTKYEAKPDDPNFDSTLQIIKAWRAACDSTGPQPSKLLIPPGTFLTNELILGGPCTAPKPITIEIQGTLLAKADISAYASGSWISIEHVDSVVVTGSGSLNGQGESAWKYNDEGPGSSTLLPNSIVFQSANNSAISNVTLINAMGFHMKVSDCSNFTASNLNITAPGDSPNTDGMHISGSTNVNVSDIVVGTGDDCISIGDSNNNIFVTRVKCGPGHGISIGSLGKRSEEQSVKGVTVTNCTLTGTTNGARIKTYRESPELEASGIIFDDIIMDTVMNPIIIDQNYASKGRPGVNLLNHVFYTTSYSSNTVILTGSKVKITDVHFKNIRGTTVTPGAVSLNCSDVVPCDGVELVDIDLSLITQLPANCPKQFHAGKGEFKAACANANATFTGKQNPPACA